MHVVKAPESYEIVHPSLFLAGSIEMGKAEDWQAYVAEVLQDESGLILNPRRDQWDPSWKQEEKNDHFREQVTWELSSLEKADVILFYLLPDTLSPISMLELGLFRDHPSVFVACPEGFWRRGNIEIVCHRYGIPLFSSLDEALIEVRAALKK